MADERFNRGYFHGNCGGTQVRGDDDAGSIDEPEILCAEPARVNIRHSTFRTYVAGKAYSVVGDPVSSFPLLDSSPTRF